MTSPLVSMMVVTAPSLAAPAADGTRARRRVDRPGYRSAMSLVHLPPTADPEEIHEVLHRDAALVIDDLADRDTIDRITAEMAPFVEATPPGSDDFSGRNFPVPVRLRRAVQHDLGSHRFHGGERGN